MNAQEQIETLRRQYGRIEKIDPEGQAYNGLCDFLDGLPDDHLKTLRDARIKWISSLALNRCIRRRID